jgi:segregation and condensation protein B
MEPALIRRIIEAALLAAQRPLSVAQMMELFPDDALPAVGAIEHAIESLRVDCAERGVELIEVASGYRYQVRAEMQPWVSRLWVERQVKYTRATLETLALIAYRQPITRGEIEQVRGVAIHSNLIKTLEEREWVRIVGHRDVPGKPALYGTTRNFLDYFGLKSLDQLPPLAELREIAELDPELPFEAAPTVAIIGMESDIERDSESMSIEHQQHHEQDPDDAMDESMSSHPSDAPDFDENEADSDAQEQTHD